MTAMIAEAHDAPKSAGDAKARAAAKPLIA